MKQIFFSVCIVLGCLVICACGEQTVVGSLRIQFLQAASSRSVVPGDDLNASSFLLTGVGPGEQTLDMSLDSSVAQTGNLACGEWSFAVEGYNGDGLFVCMGSGVTTIAPGDGNVLEIALEACSGAGTLQIALGWDVAQVILPACDVTAVDADGTVFTVTMQSSAGTAQGEIELEAGYYRIAATLSDDGDPVAAFVEIALIGSSMTTGLTRDFTALNPRNGSLFLELVLPQTAPLIPGLQCGNAALFRGETADCGFTSTGLDSYTWYLNGTVIEGGNPVAVDTALLPRYNRLDLIVESGGFSRAGAEGFAFEVREINAPGYNWLTTFHDNADIADGRINGLGGARDLFFLPDDEGLVTLGYDDPGIGVWEIDRDAEWPHFRSYYALPDSGYTEIAYCPLRDQLALPNGGNGQVTLLDVDDLVSGTPDACMIIFDELLAGVSTLIADGVGGLFFLSGAGLGCIDTDTGACNLYDCSVDTDLRAPGKLQLSGTGDQLAAACEDSDALFLFGLTLPGNEPCLEGKFIDGCDGVERLNKPVDIAAHSDGEGFIVISYYDKALLVFGKNGEQWSVTEQYVDGAEGISGLNRPYGLAINSAGTNLFVACGGDDSWSRFSRSADDTVWEPVDHVFIGPDTDADLDSPRCILPDPAGRFLWLAAAGSNALGVFRMVP